MDRIVEAAAIEARELGYEKMSVRGAARRAGVAPATAYTYFASKDHLLAEVLWRRLEALPPADFPPADFPTGQQALDRVTAELGQLSTFMAADPEVAAACTGRVLGNRRRREGPPRPVSERGSSRGSLPRSGATPTVQCSRP